jgi:hypothetical protein
MAPQSGELTGAMSGDPAELELIPRPVRDKLDRVGIKLHLREWQQLSLDERRFLRDAACGDDREAEEYRRRLDELVRARTGRTADRL